MGLEGEVEAEEEVGVRVERYELLREFARYMIHAEEEVNTGGAQVCHPSEAHAVGSG